MLVKGETGSELVSLTRYGVVGARASLKDFAHSQIKMEKRLEPKSNSCNELQGAAVLRGYG